MTNGYVTIDVVQGGDPFGGVTPDVTLHLWAINRDTGFSIFPYFTVALGDSLAPTAKFTNLSGSAYNEDVYVYQGGTKTTRHITVTANPTIDPATVDVFAGTVVVVVGPAPAPPEDTPSSVPLSVSSRSRLVRFS